jgi:hypothetical protein
MNSTVSMSGAVQELPSSDRRILWPYAVGIALWGLDFRAATSGGGAAIQGMILALYVCCFLWIFSRGSRHAAGVGPLWVLLLWVLLFLADSGVVGYLNGQWVYSIVINFLPALLYVGTAVLTYATLLQVRHNTRGFLDALRFACIASGILHLVIVYLTRGHIDLNTSRFEVLSGAVVPCLGILAVGLSQPLSMLDIAAVLLNLSIAVLSVTRTLVVSLAVQVMAVLIARPTIVFRRATLRGIALCMLVAIAIVSVDVSAGTGLTSRWVERLFLSNKLGSDPSGLSRLAESRYMWDRFTSSTQTLVFGNGLAARTALVGREHALAEILVGQDKRKDQVHSTGIGHQNYISILYVSGLFGGGGLLLIQMLNAIQSLILIRTLQARRLIVPQADAQVGIWGGVIVLGMLTIGFLSGTLQDRDECLWLGVGTGMLYWARELVKAAEQQDTPAA